MIRIILVFLMILFVPFSVSANSKVDRVIYITLDGTKWQDILDHTRLPIFWATHAKKFKIYGEPDSHTSIEVASVAISLPSYESQMSGAVQPCENNSCGRIGVETLPEYLVNHLKFKKKDVVSIASWTEINRAVESHDQTIVANDGIVDMIDPITHHADLVMYGLNKLQAADHPDHIDVRSDKYTFLQAMHYLDIHKPRFLWISFCNADTNAHANNAAGYYKSIYAYDLYIDELLRYLKDNKLDKRTLVIITTDHGRGDGSHWTSHGPKYPESKRTWAFVMNGGLKPISKDEKMTYYSTLSIRPTIEAVFK